MGEHPRVHEVDGKREFVLVGEDERRVLSKAEGECGRPATRLTGYCNRYRVLLYSHNEGGPSQWQRIRE